MTDYRPDVSLPEPAVPRWSLARVLRLCTGVDERVLSKVPGERARYTAMGGVVAGTAIIAMISMSIALYCVLDGLEPIMLAIVPVWGLFILSLDRWLMATTTMDQGAARKLLPRLLLAVAIGVIVAEPVLLGVYHTAITERIERDRADEVIDRPGELRDCNPVPGTPEADTIDQGKCGERRLAITAASPETVAAELADVDNQRETLKPTLDADVAAFNKLEKTARDECNGTKTGDTTGRFGVGPSCRRLRELADRYYTDHQIKANSDRLAALTEQSKRLNEKLATAREEWVRQRNGLIEADLGKLRERHAAGIGLLERFRALDDLVSENGYVNATQWALRIFLIIIDSLPVLLKTLNGVTNYDRRFRDDTETREREERLRDDTELNAHSLHADHQRFQAARYFQSGRRVTEHDFRVIDGNLVQERERLIEARAGHLVRQAGGRPLPAADPDATQEIPYYGPWTREEHP